MRHIKPLKQLRIKLEPIQVKMISPKSSNLGKYITFVSGSLLAISESLPFFDGIKGNGVIHTLSSIHKEYKNEFGNK